MSRLRVSLITLIVLSSLCAPQAVLACATCFGQSDSPLAHGLNMGIFTLLGFIVAVMIGTIAFFVYLARRAAAMAQAEQATEASANS